MSFWFKDSNYRVIINSSGFPINCDSCPCGGFVYGSSNTGTPRQVRLNSGDLSLETSFNFTGSLGGIFAVDDLGNYYVGDGNTVKKYDSSDTLDWSFTDADLGATRWIDVDSSYNVYVAGLSFSGFGSSSIWKLNSSGTEQWQDKISDTFSLKSATRGLAVDGSGNVVWCGGYTLSNSFYGQMLRYYNSSGTLQWNKDNTSPTTGDVDQNYHVLFDGSGNVYVSRETVTGTRVLSNIEKYNSSGTSQWTKDIGDVRSMTMDADENLYVLFDDSGTSKLRRYSDSSHSTTDWTVTSQTSTIVSSTPWPNGQISHNGNRLFQGGAYSHDPDDGSLIDSYTASGTSWFMVAEPGRYPNFL